MEVECWGECEGWRWSVGGQCEGWYSEDSVRGGARRQRVRVVEMVGVC